MKKRILVSILSLSMVASLMIGCGAKEEPAAEEVTVTVEQIPEEEVVEEEVVEEVEEVEDNSQLDEIPEGMIRSELTNLPIDAALEKQRPMAVMVDNDKRALPHFGISEADVVYELMNSTANKRITRLMCVIKDWGNIEQMGSIRSVRSTNIMLAAEWNAVLCHDGGPFYIDEWLAKDYAANFSGGFSRVNNGKATEFTEYIMPGDLDKKFNNSSYSKEYDKYYPGQHYQFNNPSEEAMLDEVYGASAIDATQVKLPFGNNQSYLVYNEETQTYDYGEFGELQKDGEDDEQITFKNVLIQNCTFSQLDDNGYMIFNCIDKGKEGYYLTNGKAIKVTWEKTGEAEITKYLNENGEEIKLNTGKTYVAFVPNDDWADLVIE